MQFNKNFFIAILLLSVTSIFSQAIWTGAGDGTNWNDAANWKDNIKPTNGGIVDLAKSATITGTINVVPGQVKISGKSTVTIATSMTIGDAVVDQHAIILGNQCKLNFGNGNSEVNFTLNPKSNRQCINVGANADSCEIKVNPKAKINLFQAQNGINIINPNTAMTNFGVIEIDSSVNNGIKLSGRFTNYGSISASFVSGDAINVAKGSFTNEILGILKLNDSGEDGVEVINDGKFINKSIINIKMNDLAGFANIGIAVGTKDSLGYFQNTNTGKISINGGVSANARSIYVYEFGKLDNEGNISCMNGVTGSRIYCRNEINNYKNAIIDVGDGKILVNLGSFTNNGYIISNFTGAGGMTADSLTTVTNNAFYKYLNGNKFATGKGTVIDNGIGVHDSLDININAGGSCTVKLANESYPWYEGSQLIGNTDTNGGLTFQAKSLIGRPAVLNTIFDSVKVYIHNYCPQANIDGGVIPEDSLYVWTGKGDGTSWQDSSNWDLSQLPKGKAFIEINKDANITGLCNITPVNFKIGGKSKVVFDLDINIGDETSDQNAINLGTHSKIQFGKGTDARTFNLLAANNKNGININNSSDSCGVIVASKAVVNFVSGLNGMNIVNMNSVLANAGTLLINSNVKTGIKSAGRIINDSKGTININGTLSDGIITLSNQLDNEGEINIANCGDDGIELISSSLNNAGTINILMKSDAGFANNGIVVDSLAAIDNRVDGIINIDGGDSENARGLFISEFGSVGNQGILNMRNGSKSSTIYSKGLLLNSKGAIIQLETGRININKGGFDNAGYIKSGNENGAGVLADSFSIVNNFAFYNYTNSNIFAIGKGAIVDTGLNVNKVVNAKKQCTIDLGEVAYPWQTTDGKNLGESTDQGLLSFAPMSLLSDSVDIKTVFDFTLKVNKICNEAVIPDDVEELQINKINVYPNILSSSGLLSIDGLDLRIENNVQFINNLGQKLNVILSQGVTKLNLPSEISQGIWYVMINNSKFTFPIIIQ